MAAKLNAGVIKAIVSFYRINSDTAFERHRSRIPYLIPWSEGTNN